MFLFQPLWKTSVGSFCRGKLPLQEEQAQHRPQIHPQKERDEHHYLQMLSRGNLWVNAMIFDQYYQGVYIEKKNKLYVKISLMEKNKVLATRKIWSDNNNMTDFSKEVFFPLAEKDPADVEILIQLKRYRGLGAKSKSCSSPTLSYLMSHVFRREDQSAAALQLLQPFPADGGEAWGQNLHVARGRLWVRPVLLVKLWTTFGDIWEVHTYVLCRGLY